MSNNHVTIKNGNVVPVLIKGLTQEVYTNNYFDLYRKLVGGQPYSISVISGGGSTESSYIVDSNFFKQNIGDSGAVNWGSNEPGDGGIISNNTFLFSDPADAGRIFQGVVAGGFKPLIGNLVLKQPGQINDFVFGPPVSAIAYGSNNVHKYNT